MEMGGLPEIITLGGVSNCGTTEEENVFKCIDKQLFRHDFIQSDLGVANSNRFSENTDKLFRFSSTRSRSKNPRLGGNRKTPVEKFSKNSIMLGIYKFW